MPNIKKIAFTFITLILIPLLFFVVLEISLKVFNVGTSYDYFNEIEINGALHYQENTNFADQFYPKGLNIGPMENTMAAERTPGLVRVLVLGGSAAKGFPHKNHGVDRLLAAQLRASLPSRNIEVVNTAMTSVNSHVVYEVASTLPDDVADYAIILMGNNEVVGPYGPSTYEQNFLANITMIRALQALKRTRIWQVLSEMIQQSNAADDKEQLKWEGMQMFTEHSVTRDDPRLESVYSHYEDNLRDIIELLNDKGIKVILSTVPVNLRHSAPFLSHHGKDLSPQQIDEWTAVSDAAIKQFDAQNWTQAIEGFKAALAVDPDYADTHFRLATAYEKSNNQADSKKHYQMALDLDALRFRADTQINGIIREVAKSTDTYELTFVDSAAAFESASQPYQPGWNLLLEHVHYDYPGNYVLAAEFGRAIVRDLDSSKPYEALSEAEMASRVGFPNHETIQIMTNLQKMIKQPPFPGQSNYADLEDFVANTISNVTETVGQPADVIKRRQAVLDKGVADWKLHFELAVLNQYARNRQATYYHFSELIKLYPHNRETYMNLSKMLSRDGKWVDVISMLEQSLYYTRGNKDKITETQGWLGTAYFRVKEYEKATDILLELIDENEDNIGITIQAYGNLIKNSKENGKIRETRRYAAAVNNYAELLIKQDKAKDYPLLNKRMSQLMTMAGDTIAANRWKTKGNNTR